MSCYLSVLPSQLRVSEEESISSWIWMGKVMQIMLHAVNLMAGQTQRGKKNLAEFVELRLDKFCLTHAWKSLAEERREYRQKIIMKFVSKYDFWHIYDSFMGKMFPKEVSNHLHICVIKLSFLIGMTYLWQFYEHVKNSFMTHLWKETHLGEIYVSSVTVLWHIYGNDRFVTVMW